AVEALLPCRVDVGQEEDVGVVERLEKLGEEIARARVAMGLERRNDPAAEALARGAQRGADLLGMVRVVVHDEDVLLLAFHLEAAVDAAEFLERMRRDAERDLEVGSDRERGERVELVMTARHAEPNGTQTSLTAPYLEHGLEPLDAQLARLPIGVRRRPGGGEALADVAPQRRHGDVVEAKDRETVG